MAKGDVDVAGLLEQRRAEARKRLRHALGACPDGFDADEWAVVLALVSPPEAAPGSHHGRATAADNARRCFPAFPLPAALRAFREVASRAHVREVVADLRAVEAQDVLEQRGFVRQVLHSVAGMALSPVTPLLDLMAMDPSGAARVGAAAASAAKVLVDLDALKVNPEDAREVKSDADPLADLAARIRRVAVDVESREVGE